MPFTGDCKKINKFFSECNLDMEANKKDFAEDKKKIIFMLSRKFQGLVC